MKVACKHPVPILSKQVDLFVLLQRPARRIPQEILKTPFELLRRCQLWVRFEARSDSVEKSVHVFVRVAGAEKAAFAAMEFPFRDEQAHCSQDCHILQLLAAVVALEVHHGAPQVNTASNPGQAMHDDLTSPASVALDSMRAQMKIESMPVTQKCG